MTSAFISTALFTASAIASSVLPAVAWQPASRSESRSTSGRDPDHATVAVADRFAPMIEATIVPCPSSSAVSPVFVSPLNTAPSATVEPLAGRYPGVHHRHLTPVPVSGWPVQFVSAPAAAISQGGLWSGGGGDVVRVQLEGSARTVRAGRRGRGGCGEAGGESQRAGRGRGAHLREGVTVARL